MSTARGGRGGRGDHGVALLITLVVLVVVLSATLLLVAVHARAVGLHREATRRLRLDALADSGADATLALLAADPYSAGLAPTEVGGGSVSSRVEPIDSRHVAVEVVADLAGLERRVRLTLELTAGGPRVVAWSPAGLGAAGDRSP